MSRCISAFAATLLFAGLLMAGFSHAADIYKWVGDDGVTHFSEVPPESGMASLEVLEVVPKEAAPADSKSYQSVLDVAKSIEDSRLERERLRLERDRLMLQKKQARQARDDIDYDDHRVYYPVYNRYPYRPYVRPYYRRHHGYPVSPYRYGHKPYGGRGSVPRAINPKR